MTAGAGETEDFPWDCCQRAGLSGAFYGKPEIISDSVKAFKVARTIKNRLADRFMKQCAMPRHLFIRKRERQFFICFAERWKREGLIRGYWNFWRPIFQIVFQMKTG